MNKLKKLWRIVSHKFKSYCLKKKRLVLIFVVLLILVVAPGIYYGAALMRVSEAEVNLAALRENINNEKICHDDCLLFRKKKENLIIAAINKSEKKLLKRLEDYWFNQDESLDFKKEIINLWRLNNDLENIPQYFFDYLDNEEGDVKLQALIISSYLSPNQDIRWLDYYLNLLISKRDVSLKKEALLALSNREDKAEHFTLKQLSLLKKLMFDKSAPEEIKPHVVLLIGDYYQLFSEDTELVLMELYESQEVDNISKAFAVDILNRYRTKKKLASPEISSEEWGKYYSY